MNLFDPAVLTAAFLAGLLGSGHCFGMCGGIAGSLGALSGTGQKESLAWPAVQFNVGRVLGYAVLGAVAAGILGAAGEIMALKPLGKWLRAVTAIMVLIIGLRFLIDWRGLDLLDLAWVLTARLQAGPGGRVWVRQMPHETWTALRALAWGLLGTGATLTALGFMTVLTLPVVATVAAGLLLMLGVGMKRASAGRVREAVASARETDRKIDRIERMLDEVL